MKSVRTMTVSLAAALIIVLAASGAAYASGDQSTDSSSSSAAPSAPSTDTSSPSASAPSSPTTTTPPASTDAPTTSTTPPPSTAVTAPSTTTTTTTTTTTPPQSGTDVPDTAPDVPRVEDCTDTPNAADCVPVTADRVPDAIPGTGRGELPFTGPGDVLVALLVAALAGTGGMLLMLGAGGRESIEALTPRGMDAPTGFRRAYRDLLRREVGQDHEPR